MKEFNLEKRRLVLSGVAIFIVVVYLVRLFALQIMSDDYRKSADSNAFFEEGGVSLSGSHHRSAWRIVGL